jgi:hypothetical protein
MKKNPKTGILDRFFTYSRFNIALINKSAPSKFCILNIKVMLKFEQISIYGVGGDRFWNFA